MTQIIRSTTLSSATAVDWWQPEALQVPLPHPISNNARGTLVVEAVRCLAHEDDPPAWRDYISTRWLIVERDLMVGRLRESTQTYASAGAAYAAYWYPDDPIEWEPWIVECWSSADLETEAAA